MTWISTIARNRAIDRLRARGPLAYPDPVEDLEIADGQPGAEALLEAAGEGRRLHACLAELGPFLPGRYVHVLFLFA